MLRKRIFKISSVLAAVIIAFSCFCISASADSNNIVLNSFSDFFALDKAEIFYLNDNSDFIDYSQDIDCQLINSTLKLTFSGDKNFSMYNLFKISCTFKVREKYQISGFSNGSFCIRVDDSSPNIKFSTRNDVIHSVVKKINFDVYSETYSSDIKWEHYSKLNAIIPKNTALGIFDTMQVDFYVSNNSAITSDDVFSFNFGTFNLDVEEVDSGLSNTITQHPGDPFNQAITFVMDILAHVLIEPSLTVLVLGFPIVSFAFVLLSRLKHS